jgi:hypothetical protein
MPDRDRIGNVAPRIPAPAARYVLARFHGLGVSRVHAPPMDTCAAGTVRVARVAHVVKHQAVGDRAD